MRVGDGVLAAALTLWAALVAASSGEHGRGERVEETARYVGEVRFVGQGHSCHPDMAQVHSIELLAVRNADRWAGVLVLSPGFVYAFRQDGTQLLFEKPTLHEERTPYVAPHVAEVTAGSVDVQLVMQWKPFDKCKLAPTELTLRPAETQPQAASGTGGNALGGGGPADPQPAAALDWWRTQLQREKEIEDLVRSDHAQAVVTAHTMYLAYLNHRGPESPDTIASANMLAATRGTVARGSPAAPESEILFERLKERPAASRIRQYACIEWAGSLYQAQRMRDALNQYKKCFDDAAPHVDPLYRHQVDALAWIGFLHGRLGEHAQALPVGQEALKRHIALYGRESEPAANIAMNVFATQVRLGRPLAAIELAEYSYETRLRLFGPDDYRTLRALNAIAVVTNSWLRQPELALPLFWKIHNALARLDSVKDAFLEDLRATVAFNLANTSRNAGKLNDAAALVDDAIRLFEGLGRPGDPENYRAHVLRVTLLTETGQHERAVAAAKDLLARLEDNLPPDASIRVLALSVYADALQASGQGQQAIQTKEAAVELARRVVAPTDPQRIIALREYAQMLTAVGRTSESIRAWREAVEGSEQLLQQAGALGDTRAGAFAAYAEAYRALGAALVEQSQLDEAFHVTQRAKARLLLESVALRGAVQAEALTLIEREELGRLDGVRAAAERKVLVSEPLARPEAEVERNRAVRHFNAYVQSLRDKYPRFARLTDIQVPPAAAADRLLPPDAAFVEYVVGEREILAFLLARGRPLTAIRIPRPKGLSELVDAYRTALLPVHARGASSVWQLSDGRYVVAPTEPELGARRIDGPAELGRQLSDLLLAPLGTTLSRSRRWILAPDAAIAHLPFDALPWNGAPAGATVVLSTTQSFSVYALGRGARKDGMASARWLGFGAPDYAVLNRLLALEPSNDPIKLALRGTPRTRSVRTAFEPLHFAEAELKAVAPLFTQRKLITGASATEKRLRALSASGELARYDILHFAAHATLDAERPSLSAVVLGATGALSNEDGLVSASEWTELKVGSRLVVLSACETGLGKNLSGEGVLGLPYAMFVAGNRNALLTLWPVADDVTSRFMQVFFARIARGDSIANALAMTKREFAAGRHGRRERDPFYWAAFVLVGPD